MKTRLMSMIIVLSAIFGLVVAFTAPAQAKSKPIEIVLSTYMPTSYGYLVTPLKHFACLLYTSPSPRDRTRSRMPSSA